ncbi:hypothetical protein L345_12142, partial [Ophiophagus hannah]
MLDGEGRIVTGPVSLNQEAKIKYCYGKTLLKLKGSPDRLSLNLKAILSHCLCVSAGSLLSFAILSLDSQKHSSALSGVGRGIGPASNHEDICTKKLDFLLRSHHRLDGEGASAWGVLHELKMSSAFSNLVKKTKLSDWSLAQGESSPGTLNSARLFN